MPRRAALALFATILSPIPALAQHGGGSAQAPATTAPKEASQFEFLIGEWELTVKVPAPNLAARIHGMPTLTGTWKAWRALDGWGIEDELRITDAAGNPRALTHTVRVFDPASSKWNVSGLDVYRSRFSAATAEWKQGEMHLTGAGTGVDGKPYQSRTRIHAITPTSFKFQQDRSTDQGKSWIEGALRIEARRVSNSATR